MICGTDFSRWHFKHKEKEKEFKIGDRVHAKGKPTIIKRKSESMANWFEVDFYGWFHVSNLEKPIVQKFTNNDRSWYYSKPSIFYTEWVDVSDEFSKIAPPESHGNVVFSESKPAVDARSIHFVRVISREENGKAYPSYQYVLDDWKTFLEICSNWFRFTYRDPVYHPKELWFHFEVFDPKLNLWRTTP